MREHLATTLEPEQKDILDKLNEVALEENWGTVDRDPNGIPKGVAVIMEAIEEIKRLRELPKEILQTAFEKVKEISAKSDYLLDDESVYEDSSLVNVLNIIGKKFGVAIDEKNS